MSTDLEKQRLLTLAQHLVEATAQRTAHWDVRADDVYFWGAGEGSVTIASRDRDGEPPYELELYTADGSKVDELASELLVGDEPAPWNDALAELYRIARRSALGADEIIDALLERLADASGPQQSLLDRARAGFSATDRT
jgi:hypothetical protein